MTEPGNREPEMGVEGKEESIWRCYIGDVHRQVEGLYRPQCKAAAEG